MGVDVGTTAVKVAAFTPAGELLRSHTVPIPTSRPREGWAEQDAGDWWRAVVAGIGAVTAGTPAGAVRAIGLVSQVNTHLLVDDDLRPLAPAVIWQDQRCAAVARELDGRFGAERKRELWGGPVTLDASYLPARAEWFARHAPDVWARTRWILSPKDYVAARLTGRIATDRLASVRLADATGTGYIGAAVAQVDGLAPLLPPLREPHAPLGPVADTALGCGDATVVVGTMDAFGSVFGSGLTVPGRAMVTCGTSLIVAGSSSRHVPTPGVVSFPPVDGVHVHAGPTQAGGDALRWWSRTAGLTVEEAVAEAATSPPGSSGVVFTPYLMGERAPLWDAEVRGSFLGLSTGTARPHLSRAVLEGVAMSARHVLAAVEEACGAPLGTVTFSGGGARSDLWAQIHADVLRRPVERLAVRDSAVLGAALLGAVGAGIHPDMATAVARAVHGGRLLTPDERNADRLEGLFQVYTASYAALRDVHSDLHAWRAQHL
ncbi:xylulose kinase [Streptomyces liangshanensis]|uniref:Xylulose kinase n=1 Tax=Streptomyces liangshanensis TaxID=2717324 RepID=A0A6G9H8L7_9ACTN|nr:xylulose kinase [Streptomyces liangshanensis]